MANARATKHATAERVSNHGFEKSNGVEKQKTRANACHICYLFFLTVQAVRSDMSAWLFDLMTVQAMIAMSAWLFDLMTWIVPLPKS
jgi:hypothetical protein